ncbi:hypothetical protein [Actinoplanes teichomyceticus]|uniref:Uncharacterized protein n=1 Tax=Actinoplanes teichomyceticus TaxID=1867 RepID=A0A561WIM6_ACTTI|nr:hypothetical protein [Actinoplanes teichomyceticus]TWG23708.1 hypothetical protein FHX34_102259 [Actinoplanes teichomyceticus]GIF11748.1 hypothetical protein Ate01nite_17800 [Actinoplanes teichomyceticus]
MDGSYFGATADPAYGVSPYAGTRHYRELTYESDYTPAPGEHNPLTIEMIAWMIANAHPERISVLGDHWQNAVTVLTRYRGHLLDHSRVLQQRDWASPQARDMFLKRGPGEALAYLDVWIEAAQRNLTALRHLTDVATESRAEMDDLMSRYRQALRDAQRVDLAGRLSEWLDPGRLLNTTWDDAEKFQIQQQVREAEREFTRQAQELAQKYANQYSEYSRELTAGAGPPFQPMNVVLNQPGHAPVTGPAGRPGVGAVTLPALPIGALPPVVPPSAPAAPGGTRPLEPPGRLPGQFPGQLPGRLPASPPGVVPGPPPGRFPAAPGPAPLFPVPGPSPLFPAPGGPADRDVVPPSLGRQPPSVPPGTLLPNPGQLTRTAFGRPAPPPGLGQPPGRTLRRGGPGPAEPGVSPGLRGGPGPVVPGPPPGLRGGPGPVVPGPPPGRRSDPGTTVPGPPPGRRSDPGGADPGLPPGRAGGRGRGEPERDARTAGAPAATSGRPPGGTPPPVLINPAGDRRRRPGSAEELHRSVPSGGAPPDGATPAVLSRPGPPGDPAVARPPARRPDDTVRDDLSGAAPARVGTARGDVSGAAPARSGAAWGDPFGAVQARSGASPGTLNAPLPPPGGSRVSRLEEVPDGLRSRAAGPGTGPPEPGRPRITGEAAPVRGADPEAPGVVTDRQAFEVWTPGGGVVTGRRERPAPEPEIGRILGPER